MVSLKLSCSSTSRTRHDLVKRDLVKNVGAAGGCRASKLTYSLGWDECGGSDPAARTERKLSSRAVAKGGGHKRQQLCKQL